MRWKSNKGAPIHRQSFHFDTRGHRTGAHTDANSTPLIHTSKEYVSYFTVPTSALSRSPLRRLSVRLHAAPGLSGSNTTRNSTLAPTVLGYSLPGATQLSQTTLHQIALHRAQSRSLEVHTKSNDQRAASAQRPAMCTAARGTHARAVCHSSHMSETVTTC